MIQVGDTIPQATVNVLDDGVQAVDTRELFDGRKVVMFAVPGAFTPTCSAKHLPGYVQHLDDFKARGVDVDLGRIMRARGSNNGLGLDTADLALQMTPIAKVAAATHLAEKLPSTVPPK